MQHVATAKRVSGRLNREPGTCTTCTKTNDQPIKDIMARTIADPKTSIRQHAGELSQNICWMVNHEGRYKVFVWQNNQLISKPTKEQRDRAKKLLPQLK